MEEFRKDPAILFVFGTPRVSDATQAVDLSGIARANAERKSDESGNLRRAGAAAAGAAGADPVPVPAVPRVMQRELPAKMPVLLPSREKTKPGKKRKSAAVSPR
jgi:hypothetical protein